MFLTSKNIDRLVYILRITFVYLLRLHATHFEGIVNSEECFSFSNKDTFKDFCS